MSARRHTPEQRAEALRLYASRGASAASKASGIPAKTISSWARREGVQTDAPNNVRAAVEMAKLTRDERKARLADALLEDAEKLRATIWTPATVHHWGTESVKDGSTVTTSTIFMEHEIAVPTFGDQRNALTSAAIAIDKSALLAGEATNRTEQIGDTRERVVHMRDDLAERRRRKALSQAG